MVSQRLLSVMYLPSLQIYRKKRGQRNYNLDKKVKSRLIQDKKSTRALRGPISTTKKVSCHVFFCIQNYKLAFLPLALL